MIRYTSCGGTISRIEPLGHGSHVVTAVKRVPAPVREIFAHGTFGRTEVEYDPKIKQARLLEYWERWRI